MNAPAQKADFPESHRLVERILSERPERLAVLPPEVISEAMDSLLALEKYHDSHLSLIREAAAKLMAAWRTRP